MATPSQEDLSLMAQGLLRTREASLPQYVKRTLIGLRRDALAMEQAIKDTTAELVQLQAQCGLDTIDAIQEQHRAEHDLAPEPGPIRFGDLIIRQEPDGFRISLDAIGTPIAIEPIASNTIKIKFTKGA